MYLRPFVSMILIIFGAVEKVAFFNVFVISSENCVFKTKKIVGCFLKKDFFVENITKVLC